MNSLLVLGSTGSIGTQTLDCVRTSSRHLKVEGLVAARSFETVLKQVEEFRPRFVALTDLEAAEALATRLPADTKLFRGPDAAREMIEASSFDVAVNGIVGAAGLSSSIAVLERGKTLALANKESLVVAGHLLIELARERGATIVPVDSEHCAIFQCLIGEDRGKVRRILLTASGGPFRERPIAQMTGVTPSEALRHPNWDMGPRITIGSATLMNKALEVIEVHHLYELEAERIEVVIHPQSVVHSMVEFVDGSVMAQLGPPDMRGPIHYCLNYPERKPAPLSGFDFETFSKLTFEKPDVERFPALELGFDCVRAGEDSGCALNAADEVAVQAFLDGEIQFTDISRINRTVMERRSGQSATVDELLLADAEARRAARVEIDQLAQTAS